jgi:hypothetical protein
VAATNFEHDQVLLLILEREKQFIPISGAAFHVGQTSRKNLRTRYKDALVISRQGVVHRIDAVEIIGLWGDTFPRKFLSLLTSAWAIRVRFSPPLSLNLDELKSKIIFHLQEDQRRVDPYFSLTGSLDEVINRIRGAALFTEAFDSLEVPEANNCLDVL